MKKLILVTVLFILLLSSCGGSHLYDNAEVLSVVNADYKPIGEYAVREADSTEVTKDALEDVYYNYFSKKDLEYLVVVYTDKAGSGAYINSGYVEEGVSLEQDQNADYMLSDDNGATIYYPDDGKLSDGETVE